MVASSEQSRTKLTGIVQKSKSEISKIKNEVVKNTKEDGVTGTVKFHCHLFSPHFLSQPLDSLVQLETLKESSQATHR